MLTSFLPNLFPHGEGGIGRLGHFVSLAGIPLSQYERHPSLKDERGIGQDAHFVSAQSLPSWRREELDSAVIPFRQLLSQYERGIGQEAHFVSHLALRVTAGGRNP